MSSSTKSILSIDQGTTSSRAIVFRADGAILGSAQKEQAPLPVVLCLFGLISLEQFDDLLSWQDQE